MPQKGKILFKIMVLFLLQVVANIHTDLLKKNSWKEAVSGCEQNPWVESVSAETDGPAGTLVLRAGQNLVGSEADCFTLG